MVGGTGVEDRRIKETVWRWEELVGFLPSNRASATDETTSRKVASGSLRGFDRYNPSTSVSKKR